MNILKRLANLFDKINEIVGKGVSYMTLALVITMCVDVFLRNVFNTTEIWILELELYFFAMIFMIGAGYAFKHDKHVRVDVFYSKFSPKGQAWVNLIGGVLFLMPWCIVVLQVAFRYANVSFQMNEGSAQPGGLPALYIFKSFILIGFIFLMLQAISSIIRSLLIITDTK